MKCFYCKAESADNSLRCTRCGRLFAEFSEAETIAGAQAEGGAQSPLRHAAGETIGVVTPPPSSQNPAGLDPSIGLPAFTAVLAPGADFGPRYRIESLLGKGGMGLVYKAYDRELDREVALKLVRPELTMDPEAMRRFKQELLLASKISHKHILRIHDLGEVGGIKFISMAYVEGEDLHHLIRRTGRLSVDRSVAIARQLCSALGAAHAEGVIHRDLKPQNVLIDTEGNVYVSDFGLAKSLESASGMMTQTGEVLGTPRYMSPEQAQGQPADHRSDLYSLGLMLYEMVTGDIPFSGGTVPQLLLQRITQKVKNPSALYPDVPEHLSRIILRCLEVDPAHRYASASEVLRDLYAGQTPRSSRSLQISVSAPESKVSRLAAAAIVLLIIAGVAFFAFRKLMHPAVTGHTQPAVAGIPSLTQGKYLVLLPFRVLGNQSSLGYVAEGLNEALAAKLFNIRGLHVASPDASEQGAKQGSLSKVAKELGANLAVEGTLQGAGGHVAIVVRLVDVGQGRLLWTQEFTGVTGDLLTIEDRISSKLVDALQLHPGNQEMAQTAAHPTENVAAYDMYLKGRDAMRGVPDEKTAQAAVDLFQNALTQDPGFALAYAGLADAALRMYEEKKDRFWMEKAMSAAQQAQQLNSNEPQVYLALGDVYRATGRYSEAIGVLKRAIQLAPNSDEGYRRLGAAYEANGEAQQAVAAFKKAVQIDPYYWANADDLGKAYDAAGDYGQALHAFNRVIQLKPDAAAGYENVGGVYLQEGQYGQAVPVLQKALQISPTYGHYSNLGTAYFYLRRYDDAIKALEKAVELSPQQEVLVGNLAQAYRLAGRNEEARKTFDQAIAMSYKQLQINPRDAPTMADLALYYASEGQYDQALQFIRNARSIDPADPDYVYGEAVVQTLAGKSREALQGLRDAFQKGFATQQAIDDPNLANLQSNAAFKQLVEQFNHGAH